MSRALSTAVFHQSHLHYNLPAVIHQKGSYNSLFLVISSQEKPRNFKEFSVILESFWRILGISKRILELFGGNSGKNFRQIFGNYVAKHNICSLSVVDYMQLWEF